MEQMCEWNIQKQILALSALTHVFHFMTLLKNRNLSTFFCFIGGWDNFHVCQITHHYHIMTRHDFDFKNTLKQGLKHPVGLMSLSQLTKKLYALKVDR